MKSRSIELLDRAVSAMRAAVEIYNKPGFPYRMESFAILAINGWELLLKARVLTLERNKLQALYTYEYRRKSNGEKSRKRSIKRTRSGMPHTKSISQLGNKLVSDGHLDRSAYNNIETLVEFRNCATHFYATSLDIQRVYYKISAACVMNFSTAIRDWFGKDISEFDLQLMPLAFIELPSNVEGLLLNATEKNFLSFIENIIRNDSTHESQYSVMVNVDFKLSKSKDKRSLQARITTDPSAPELRVTEEQVLEKYPWDYNTLTGKCKERYEDFKQNICYHRLRKLLEDDEKFAKRRLLDPNKPTSSKKTFYHPRILNELDNHYTKKP